MARRQPQRQPPEPAVPSGTVGTVGVVGVVEKAPFQVGDRVTTEFYRAHRWVVRRITWVQRHQKCASGWLASADAGEPCPCCQVEAGTPTSLIDAAWFQAAPAPYRAAPPWTFLEDDVLEPC